MINRDGIVARQDISYDPVSFDDVVRGVLDHGFLDVSSDSLAWHMRVPVNNILAACEGELVRAVSKAVDIIVEESAFPSPRDHWITFLEDNVEIFQKMLSKNMGVARLYVNGILGGVMTQRIFVCGTMLTELGLTVEQMLTAMETVFLSVVNTQASIEGALSETGNLAEFASPYSGIAHEPDHFESPFIAGFSQLIQHPEALNLIMEAVPQSTVLQFVTGFEDVLHVPANEWMMKKIKIEIAGLQAYFGLPGLPE